MPITIYILNVKENGHEFPTVYKKDFRDIRIWLVSYFVGLGQDENDIPLGDQEFFSYCSSFKAAPDVKIRLVELVTGVDPESPIYGQKLIR